MASIDKSRHFYAVLCNCDRRTSVPVISDKITNALIVMFRNQKAGEEQETNVLSSVLNSGSIP